MSESAPSNEPAGPIVITPAEAARRAATLDFKRVGVLTWRARSQRGRFYDFSDIRTFRKHLQEGKLTPADSLSVDGRTWTVIGEIPSLDLYFIETWDRLHVARGGTPGPALVLSVDARPLESVPIQRSAPVLTETPLSTSVPLAAPVDVPFTPPHTAPAQKAARRGFEGPLIAAFIFVAFLGGAITAVWWVTRAPTVPAAPAATLAQPAPAPAATGTTLSSPSATTTGSTGATATGAPTGGTTSRPRSASTAATSTTGSASTGVTTGRATEPAPAPAPAGMPTIAESPDDPAAAIRAHLHAINTGDRSALIQAAKVEATGPAPGEGPGVLGDEGPSDPSDIVYIQEIPADQVEKVLREEGMTKKKNTDGKR